MWHRLLFRPLEERLHGFRDYTERVCRRAGVLVCVSVACGVQALCAALRVRLPSFGGVFGRWDRMRLLMVSRRLRPRTANLLRGSGPGKDGHRPHSKCSKCVTMARSWPAAESGTHQRSPVPLAAFTTVRVLPLAAAANQAAATPQRPHGRRRGPRRPRRQGQRSCRARCASFCARAAGTRCRCGRGARR